MCRLPATQIPGVVSISMDFIEGLPKSNGYDSIYVVADRLSKYAHFIPLRHPFSATTVVASFVDEVVQLRLQGTHLKMAKRRWEKVELMHDKFSKGARGVEL